MLTYVTEQVWICGESVWLRERERERGRELSELFERRVDVLQQRETEREREREKRENKRKKGIWIRTA